MAKRIVSTNNRYIFVWLKLTTLSMTLLWSNVFSPSLSELHINRFCVVMAESGGWYENGKVNLVVGVSSVL